MKDCLIIGNKNAVTTKYVFPLLKDRVLKTGYTIPRDYTQPEWCETKTLNGLTGWFTTLPVTDKEPLVLTAHYSPEKYPKYDNYDAIECGKVCEIPMDYDGVIGVPITFLDKYCPTQFEILGITGNKNLYGLMTKKYTGQECKDAYVAKFGKDGIYDLNATCAIYKNGLLEKTYGRIFIRKRNA